MSEAPLILAFAAAAVVDTVLLAILLERRAWRGSLAPLAAVVAGALLFHLGRTIDLGMRASPEPTEGGWRLAAQLLTGAGALLIPSALLHTALRLWDSGLLGRLRFDPRYALCYAPLVILLGIPAKLEESPGGSLLDAVGPLLIPYSVWVSLVTLCVAAGLFALRDGSRRVRVQRFLTLASLWLGVWTALFWALSYLGFQRPGWREACVLSAGLGPTVLGLLFAHYVVRFHFWALMAERLAVLSATAAAVTLFHALILSGLRPLLPFRGVVLMALEVAVIIGAAGAYGPVRSALRRHAAKLAAARPAHSVGPV
jgi:hypothetical protein